MVLKRLNSLLFNVLLVLTISSNNVLADVNLRPQLRSAIKDARNYYKLGRYKKVIRIIKQSFSPINTNSPEVVLRLASLAYKKSNKYKKALKLINLLLKKKYRKKHSEILTKYKADRNADDLPDDIEDGHFKSILAKAKIYHLLLLKTNSYKYARYATIHATIAVEGENTEDKADSLLQNINAWKQEQKDKKYASSYSANVSYLTYNTTFNILGEPSEIATVMVRGVCYGGGYTIENAHFQYNVDGCFGIFSSNAQVDSNSFSYNTSEIPTSVFLIQPSALYKPKSKEVAIGLTLPILTQAAIFGAPDGYTVDKIPSIGIGYGVVAKWIYKNFASSIKTGRIIGFKSSWLQIQAEYHF